MRADILDCTAFLLERLQGLPYRIAISPYVVAIPLGGWHWLREGTEELIAERKIDIEILIMSATLGAGMLGLWDETAALVVRYGAAGVTPLLDIS
ncbi:MAG: cadmium transporter ATPase [Gammaproteobacteria bacterium]|nr:cadmium transporter ATPase [Gammaproteobacteria bacterium]